MHVRAIGVGIHDSSFLPRDGVHPFPIGIEAAGTVEQIGAGVSGYQRGDRIAFVSSMQPKGGTWAEFAAVAATSSIIPMPAGMDFTEAAAVPVAGNTALRALHALTAMPVGSTLFIAGGSGAIGTFAIQLARRRGWRVAASASAGNHEYLRMLGAEQVVDYRASDWRDQVLAWMPGGVDAAIAVQPGTSNDSLPVVKDGGQLVSVSGDELLSDRGIRMSGIAYHVDVREELAALMAAIDEGEMHLEIEHVYPFDEAAAALAKAQTRRARGKSVLRIG